MTDPDRTIDPSELDAPMPRSSATRPPSGLWRVLSFGAVFVALAITALSVFQSRAASDVPVLERSVVVTQNTTVTVTGIPTGSGAEVAVLGLAASESRTTFDPAGTDLAIPSESAAVVGLTTAEGALVGLAVARENADRATTEISPTSTARALIVLSPGVLRPDLDSTYANLGVIEQDEAFDKLVAALTENPDLSSSNDVVEQAYAEIADRLPAHRPAADQGCDSVIANDAYPAAGTCVQPRPTGLVIENEQDRWVLVYSDDDREDPNALPCAAVSPAGRAGDELLVPFDDCAGLALLAAPGPLAAGGEAQAIVEDRVRTAAALTALYEYAGPFAELAGASTGFTDNAMDHLRGNTDDIVGTLARLVADDPEFATAADVARRASTALDRHTAAVSAARIMIEAADTTALIPQRIQGEAGHHVILDFFVRSGERMVGTRTDWRWEADATGTADFSQGEA